MLDLPESFEVASAHALTPSTALVQSCSGHVYLAGTAPDDANTAILRPIAVTDDESGDSATVLQLEHVVRAAAGAHRVAVGSMVPRDALASDPMAALDSAYGAEATPGWCHLLTGLEKADALLAKDGGSASIDVRSLAQRTTREAQRWKLGRSRTASSSAPDGKQALYQAPEAMVSLRHTPQLAAAVHAPAAGPGGTGTPAVEILDAHRGTARLVVSPLAVSLSETLTGVSQQQHQQHNSSDEAMAQASPVVSLTETEAGNLIVVQADGTVRLWQVG